MFSILLAGAVACVSLEPARLPAGSQAAAGLVSPQDRLKRVSEDVFTRPERLEPAVKELKEILAGDPRSAEAHFLLGIAYRRIGSAEFLAEAKAELRQALALNSEFLPARFYLAQLYLDLGRADRAREELQAALVQAPDQPQFLALLGEAERQLKNPQRSLELNRQVLQANASFAQARYYLSLALLDLGERNEAIQELERIATSGPTLPEVYVSLGTAYLDAGRLDDGVAALRQGLAIDPARPDLRIQLARAYRSKGQLDAAVEQLKAAQPAGTAALAGFLYPQVEFDLYLETGLLSLQQGKLDAAVEAFQKVLSMDPNYGPTHRHIAEAYLARGSYKLAAEHAARAEQLGAPLSEDKRALLRQKLRGK